MSAINLKATKREELGKKIALLREQGLVPAVLYGNKIENQNITVPANVFDKIYQEAGTSTLVDLQIGDGTPVKVLITDVQKDPVLNNFIHVDFLQVDMKKEITAEVTLHFVGESPIVKSSGGNILRSLEHVTVKCLPENLPHDLSVDLGKLDSMDAHFTVADLELPKGVVVVNDPNDVIALVKAQKAEEVFAKPEVVPTTEVVAGDKKDVTTDKKEEKK